MQLQQLPLATAAVSVQPHTDSFSYKVRFLPLEGLNYSSKLIMPLILVIFFLQKVHCLCI